MISRTSIADTSIPVLLITGSGRHPPALTDPGCCTCRGPSTRLPARCMPAVVDSGLKVMTRS